MNQSEMYRQRKRIPAERFRVLSDAGTSYKKFTRLRRIALTLRDQINAIENELPIDGGNPMDLAAEVKSFECELIKTVLARVGGNQTRAAKLLGLRLSTLSEKIKRFGLRY